MPEPTATNPQTGEKVVLRGGQWVPLNGAAPAAPVGGPVFGAAPAQAKPPVYQPPSGYRGTPAKLEPIPGGPADNPVMPAPGNTTLAGEDYLKTLDAGLAGQVRALAEGRRAFPTGTALKDPKVQELIAAATQYDPALDAANAATRVSTRRDFTSGSTARNITAINTAIGHLGTLKATADQLDNRSFPLWNTIANAAETAVGDPRVKRFGIARDAVANELMRVFRQTGASTTEVEEWKHTIDSSDSPEQLHAAISTAVDLLNSRVQAIGDQYSRGMGQSKDPISLLSPHAQEVFNSLSGGAPPPPAGGNGAPPAGGNPPPGGSAPQYDSMVPATGSQRLEPDPQTRDQLDTMLRGGAGLDDVNRFLAEKGDEPLSAQDYGAVRQAIAKGQPYRISAQRYQPVTPAEQAITSVGSGAAGAYALGAGQMLSGGTLDNMAGDPNRARLAMSISQAQNPTANALGQVSGGIMAGLAGEAGLARLGMGAGIARGAVADAAMGGANGAGNADAGGRASNALMGALTAGGASVGGSLALRGAANALAPTGGALKALYESGVRPSVGQRFAASGRAGQAVNATEEKLQSVPVVGDFIRGTRNRARDQFQIGAFNQALAEVGEELPKGMKPGTDPHKYAQQVFSRAYNEARSGMHVVADEELQNDIGSLFQRVDMLAAPSQSRFKAITRNVVMRRLLDGQLSGDAYKAAYSDLGKQIRGIRNSPTGDGELADALQGLQDTLDSAARRHSNPDAVALLDAADAGYAKLVRIEDASRRRGGEQGTFSPLQFDSAVQKEAGGTRSKAYLRGDALMQDYAAAGRSLGDYTPNSGTVDRGLAAGLALGAGKVAPPAAVALGAIGLANAPGVRNLTTAAMAPRGPAAQRIAERLRNRARLLGATTAASAVAALPGTSPGQ